MDDSLCLRALHSIGVDMAHHIMANLFLTRLCHIVVDILRVGLQLFDLLFADGKPQLPLGLRQGNPQTPPGLKFHIR